MSVIARSRRMPVLLLAAGGMAIAVVYRKADS
jgi:hypothetical protein